MDRNGVIRAFRSHFWTYYERWTFKNLIFLIKKYESYLWRHQFAFQRRSPKSVSVGFFQYELRKPSFDRISYLIRWKRIQTDQRHLQNAMGRSGNFQEVQIRLCKFFSTVLSEIPRLIAQITPRCVADPIWSFLVFNGW